MIAYDDITVAGLFRVVLDETVEGHLAAAYRTSLNNIDRSLGLKLVSNLSANDIKDFTHARREGADLGSYPEAIGV